jgi:hypothetical protein
MDGDDRRATARDNPTEIAPDKRLTFAANYCNAGFRLLPTLDKFPPKGFMWGTAASSDLAVVRRWLDIWPECDLAIALPPHIVVVDLDVRDGRDGFQQFIRIAGSHPDDVNTIQAITQSGGRHVWFDADDWRFPNCVGDAATRRGHPGLETKTSGGYVVVPPAPGRHWIAGKRTMLPAPESLKELFPRHEPTPVAPARTARAHTPYGQKTLDRLTLRIATTPRGEQDNTRTRLAYTIGQYVGGGEIEAEDGWTQILIAARAAPTGIDRNALRKEKYLRRSFEQGMRSPRSWATEWNALDAMAATLDAAAEREMADER